MAINPKYKRPQKDSKDLRIPVTFYKKESTGPEPNQKDTTFLYSCFAEAYNPSMKDMEILKAAGTKEGLTLRIRNALTDYVPSNRHFVEVDHYMYKGKVFNIVDVAPDLIENRFIKIVMRYTT
jgi:hypothetical protein